MELIVTLISIIGITFFLIYGLISLSSRKPQEPSTKFYIPDIELEKFAKNDKLDNDIESINVHPDNSDIISNDKKEWSIGFIQSIEWREFEKLCCRILTEQGFIVEQCQLGPDGGIDICIYSNDTQKTLVAIGQCKAWSNKLGEKTLREFCGVMADRKISKGYFFSSGEFLPKAKEFGKRNKIEVINGFDLLGNINNLPKSIQESILSEIIKTDYTTPTCVRCGIKMQMRKSKFGTEFWGCRNYSRFPKCTFKLNIKKTG